MSGDVAGTPPGQVTFQLCTTLYTSDNGTTQPDLVDLSFGGNSLRWKQTGRASGQGEKSGPVDANHFCRMNEEKKSFHVA